MALLAAVFYLLGAPVTGLSQVFLELELAHDRRRARRAYLRCRHLGRRHVCDLCLPPSRAQHTRAAAAPAADAGHLPEILPLGVGDDPAAARQRLLDGVHDLWRLC